MKMLWTSYVLKMQSNFLKAYLYPHTHLCTNKFFRHVQQNWNSQLIAVIDLNAVLKTLPIYLPPGVRRRLVINAPQGSFSAWSNLWWFAALNMFMHKCINHQCTVVSFYVQNSLCLSVSFQWYIFIIFSTRKYCSQEVFTRKKERQSSLLLEEHVGLSMKKKNLLFLGGWVWLCMWVSVC